jgi:hypothetical protein
MATKLSDTIKDLSTKLAEKFTIVDGKLVIDPDAYTQTLPENISVETLKQVHDHNSNFYPAVSLAAGNAARQAMALDKTIEEMHVEVPMLGGDRFNLTAHRSRTFPIPKSDKVTLQYGTLSATLVTQSARASRGAMNHVRDYLAAEALKVLGGK